MGHGEEEDEEGLQLHLQSEASGLGRHPDTAVRPTAEQDLPGGRLSSKTSRCESTSLSHSLAISLSLSLSLSQLLLDNLSSVLCNQSVASGRAATALAVFPPNEIILRDFDGGGAIFLQLMITDYSLTTY